MNKVVWKLAIHMSESNIGYEILWVLPLAYLILFETKAFVIVIVVVVVFIS
jgi:hypothetical protein